MKYLKKAWRFFLRNWKWFASGLAILLAAFLSLAYKRNSKKAKILKHSLNVRKAEREIGRLEGRREIIRKAEGSVASDMAIIDAEVKKLDNKITASRAEVDKLSSRKKLEEFKKLGF